MIANDTQRVRLAQLIEATEAEIGKTAGTSAEDSLTQVEKQLVRRLCLHHEAAPLVGHVLLDALEEAGYGPEDFDIVQAVDNDAALIGAALLHASASRGLDLDVVVGATGGSSHPLQRGTRIVLVSAAELSVEEFTKLFEAETIWEADIVCVASVFSSGSTIAAEADARNVSMVSAVDIPRPTNTTTTM